jgi:hypothetical protein
MENFDFGSHVFPVFLLEPVLDLNDFNLRSCVLFVFLSSSVSGNRSSVANRVLLCTVFVFPVELPSFAMARKFHRRRCFCSGPSIHRPDQLKHFCRIILFSSAVLTAVLW